MAKLIRVKTYVVVTTTLGRLVVGPEPVMTYSGETVLRTKDALEVWADGVNIGVVYRKSSWWYAAHPMLKNSENILVTKSQQQGSRDLAVATLSSL